MNQPPKSVSLSYRWLVFWLLGASFVFSYFMRTNTPVVALDIMQDLQVGGGWMGLIISATLYGYALAQIPIGMLLDSWGARRTVAVFFCAAAIGTLIFGLTSSPALALVARLMIGLGVGSIFISALKILANWFSTREYSIMVGVLQGMGGIGLLLGGLPMAWICLFLGWRGAFVAIGLVMFLLAIALGIWVRNAPADMGLADFPRSTPLPEETAAAAETDSAPGLGRRVVLVAKYREFWWMAWWFIGVASLSFCFGGLWGGPYLMEVHGLDKSQAGLVLSTLALGMFLGSPFLTWLSDRILHSHRQAMYICTFVSTGLLLLLYFFADHMGIAAFACWFFLFAVAVNAAPGLAWIALRNLIPVNILGTASGMLNATASGGGALSTLLTGIALEVFSGGKTDGFTLEAYAALLLILTALSLSGLLGLFNIRETYSSD